MATWITPWSSRSVNVAGTRTRRQIIGLMPVSQTLTCKIASQSATASAGFSSTLRRAIHSTGSTASAQNPTNRYALQNAAATVAEGVAVTLPTTVGIVPHLKIDSFEKGRFLGQRSCIRSPGGRVLALVAAANAMPGICKSRSAGAIDPRRDSACSRRMQRSRHLLRMINFRPPDLSDIGARPICRPSVARFPETEFRSR